MDNTAVTGIFCNGCYQDVAPKPGWRAYITPPAALGAAAIGFGQVLDITVNGLSYTMLGSGAVAALAGLIGLATAGKSMPEWKSKQMAICGVVVAMGVLSVVASGIV